jgi:hypothetical protein
MRIFPRSSLWIRLTRVVPYAGGASERTYGRAPHNALAKLPQRLFHFSPKTRATVVLLGAVGATTIASTSDDTSVKHLALAFVRCERIARAVVYDAILYKRSFSKTYASDEERQTAYSRCHQKSAERVLEALKANGGAVLPSKNPWQELKFLRERHLY